MPDDRATQISARLAAATPGTWEWVADDSVNFAELATREENTLILSSLNYEMVEREGDADLIANAPSDLAWLLAERAELLRRVEAAERAGAVKALWKVAERVRSWSHSAEDAVLEYHDEIEKGADL